MADIEGQERGEGKDELEDKGDLWIIGECLRGDCLRGDRGIGERMGLPLPLPGEEQIELESVVSSSSLASCQQSGTPNL